MKEGVSIGILPRTIQDTITIASRLDLDYIWIDRLCILQDCQEDWSREASRMAFIYKHAYLTISASCASHEHQGCFRKRNAAGIQPWCLTSNPLLPSNQSGWSHVSSHVASKEPKIYQKEGGKLGYLADRGWIFQERVFSQRIIHFAEEEVYWECKELQASEAWPEPTKYFSMNMGFRPSIASNSLRKNQNEQQLWYHLVKEYSPREFTYDRDKLPALSGLSRERAELRKDTKDEYLAGLWRSTMPIGLCCKTFDDTTRIPEGYLAPSWSWASLHSKALYVVNVIFPPKRGWGYRLAADFKDARLKLATEDPYGAVHDGWIHLIGHLRPVTVVRQPASREHEKARKFWPERICGIDGKPLSFLISLGKLDIESFEAGGSRSVPIFCLPVIEVGRGDREPATYPEVYCLLLVRDGSIQHKRSGSTLPSPKTQYADEYQRAGMAYINVKERVAFNAWLDESPKRSIVIR